MKLNKKGFTLVELIVVISILAVLALILVPSIIGYTAKAKEAVGKANAKSCYSQLVAKQASEAAFTGTTAPSITIDGTKCKPVSTDNPADLTLGAKARGSATGDIYKYVPSTGEATKDATAW